MSRVRVAGVVSGALALIAAVFPSPYSVVAEDVPAAKAPADAHSRGRVPPHFAKLDLTSDQKTRIYAIQDQYDDRIDALLAEIEELRVQRDSEVESVLSAGQRSDLKGFLEHARIDRMARSKEAEAARKAYEAMKKKAAGKK